MEGLRNGIHAGGPMALAAIQRVVADLHAHMSGAHGALKLRMQLKVIGLQGLAQFERAVTQVGVTSRRSCVTRVRAAPRAATSAVGSGGAGMLRPSPSPERAPRA